MTAAKLELRIGQELLAVKAGHNARPQRSVDKARLSEPREFTTQPPNGIFQRDRIAVEFDLGSGYAGSLTRDTKEFDDQLSLILLHPAILY